MHSTSRSMSMYPKTKCSKNQLNFW